MNFYIIFAPAFWLIKTLLLYFSVVVALTIASRCYKLIWARRSLNPVRSSEAILITGATSGIGLALAKHLYALGYSVIVGYYDNRELGYTELRELGDKRRGLRFSGETDNSKQVQQRMIFLELDVRSQDSIERAYSECEKSLADNKLKLFALINNAGVGSLQPFAWLQRKTIKNLIDTNLLGSLLVTREFLPLLVESSGRILNVSSGLGLVPGATYATYGITKCSLIYLTRCLNMELKDRYGVQTISVIPHNFIKNTNICAMNVKNNEAAWDQMKPIERKLYKKEFSHQCELAKSLEEATKKHSKLSSSATSATGKKLHTTGKELAEKQQVASWRSLFKGFWCFVERLQGENAALTLEESGALECFEDALRLVDPPEHIFAGDNIYNLLVGSILLSVPTSCTGLLGAFVSPSLYR